ncbi:tRNA epoxyqueuosine(34) reductase QueG [uncultured Clostridium sp.]|uniref:tRNA epoxyqueuosine(34) reductase QueG n=1 Tax=uncultured Clostridium sp. TaxID=59620 RepID=UPI0026717893|nr:tRNA epoxyqueuosine(34) reductase QueG [uncultured Clostridium sp.]
MIKDKIIGYCNSLGLDTLGFIPCRRFEELVEFYKYRKENNLENEFEEKEIEKRINPKVYMEDGKTIISIAFPYYHEDVNENNNGFSIYTKRGDYHRVVKEYLEKICIYINSLGWEAISFVDSNYLPERYIAYLAGVGFIGRNNMIITEKYGSYVFLGEIITNAKIECNEVRSFQDIRQFDECSKCDICIKECPTKSINKNRINPNICLSYITQKKDINDKEIKLLKGNVFGCDFCQLKCPYNEGVKINVLEEFNTLEYMNEDTYMFANMDNKIFKEKIAKTSCGWRGKNVIRRNAIIKMHNENYDIEKFKGPSPYINNYIEILKKK